MNFTAIVIAAVAAALLLAVLRGRTVILLVIFTAALPPLLVLVAMSPVAESFGDVRLRVTRVVFADRSLVGEPASIGGGIATDDVLTPGLPPGIASIVSGGRIVSDPTRRNDSRPTGRNWSEAGIVSIERDRVESFLGAHPLNVKDRLCLSRCDARDAIWFELASGGKRLARVGDDAELPEFRDRYLFSYAPNQAIYPIRDYGRAVSTRDEWGDDPCLRRFLCADLLARPVRSFLFRDTSAQLHVALLDPEAVLERIDDKGQVVGRIEAGASVPQPLGATEENGRQVTDPVTRITIWQVDYADPTVDFMSVKRASALGRRRVLVPSVTKDGVELAFQLQPVNVISERDIGAMRSELNQSGVEAPVAVALSGERPAMAPVTGADVLTLGAIGGSLAAAISPETGSVSSLIFGAGFNDTHRARTLLPAIGGAIQPQTGAEEAKPDAVPQAEFLIGAGDNGEPMRAIALRVDRFVYPAFVLPILSGWAFLFLFLQLFAWRERPSAVILCLGLQIMCVMRMFVAIGSAALDPQLDAGSTLAGALLACCALPYLLAALTGRRDAHPALYWAPGLALLGLAVLFRSRGELDLFSLVLTSGAAFTGLLRPLWIRFVRGDAVAKTRATWRWLGHRAAKSAVAAFAAGSVLRVPMRLRRWTDRIEVPVSVRPWLWFALALALGRGILFLFGIRERYVIAISVIYVPLMLLCAAGLLWALRRANGPVEAYWIAGWSVVAAGLALGAPALVADLGFVLCFLPAILCVAAAFVPHVFDRAWKRALLFAPAVGVTIAFALSAAVATFAGNPGAGAVATPTAPVTQVQAQEALERFADSSQNEWRLLTIYSPQSLEAAGTRGAEQMRRWRYLLASFTGSRDGHGLGYRAQISDLRAVQADDNVSAIHLMAPFGRNGAAALLLLLGVTAWGAVHASQVAVGLRRTYGMLAVWTIFGVSAYMILANLVLVPFTGRNVYLMAAHSQSDLLEAFILFAIACLCLSLPQVDKTA